MYDAEGRLVVSNKRYQQIYDAPDELCRPGVLYTDITALRDAPTRFQAHPEIGRVRGSCAGRGFVGH